MSKKKLAAGIFAWFVVLATGVMAATQMDAKGVLTINQDMSIAIGGNNDEIARSIQQTSDGGFIMAGYTKSFGAGKSDVYILKLDKDGNPVRLRK